MTPFDTADRELGFIGELCVALAHRWDPERLFMIFTAYLDESDTHGAEPNVIMGGFLASARQWELFGRRLRKLQRDYGFKIIHATDFRGRRGEFEGWSIEKCRTLTQELGDAMRDYLTEGVTALLPHTLYKTAYDPSALPKGMHRDSQYGLCFRACLYRFIHTLDLERGKHRLHVVIEAGHRNAKDTLRVFDDVKAEMVELGIEILATVTLAKKSECDFLMVADLQAHLASVSEANLKH